MKLDKGLMEEKYKMNYLLRDFSNILVNFFEIFSKFFGDLYFSPSN